MESEILPNLYIGNIHDGRSFNGEKICVQEEKRCLHDIGTHHLPLLDEKYEVGIDNANKISDKINELLKKDKRVIVYCGSGKGRGPVAIQWYLVRYKGFTRKEALEAVKLKHQPTEERHHYWNQLNLQEVSQVAHLPQYP